MSDYTSDKDTNDLIDSFLIDGDYLNTNTGLPDLDAWMADSDYVKEADGWYHDGNYVDPVDMVLIAIEACGFQRTWIVTIDIACSGSTPDEALSEWIACNGTESVVALMARYENPVTGYSVGW